MSERIIPLRVSGYHISITGDGDVGSASAASVVFRTYFDETWDGMAITAKFTDAAGASVTDVLLTDQQDASDGAWLIPMPHEVTAYEGNALLTFSGALLDDDKIVKHTFSGSGITGVTINAQTMMGYDYGTYNFTYTDDDGWLLDGDACDIGDYGITVEGTAADGDTIVVTLTRSVLRRQTTKPLEFHVYASETERTGYNTEPITASDREQLHIAIWTSEAYAKGTKNGTPVTEGQTGYHDNAKYYSETAEDWAVGTRGGQTGTHTTDNAEYLAGQAADAADDSADYAEVAREYAKGEKRDGTPVVSGETGYHDNAAYYNDQAHAWVDGTGASSGDPQYNKHAKKYAQDAGSAKNDAETARDTAALWATGGTSGTPSAINNAKKYAENAGDAAQAAYEYAEAADGSAQTAEAWAVGTREGETDPSHASNNSQYWSFVAEENAYDAEDWAVGTRDGETGEHADECAKHYAEEAATAAETAVAEALDEVLPIAAANLATDAVETAKIKDLNVTTDKLAAKAVTTGKIADGAVGTTQLGSKAVQTGNIDDGAVGTEQLSDGAVSTAKVENRAITAPKIGIGEVKTPNLDTGAVVTSKIYDGAVTTAKLAADAKELIYSMLPTESAQGGVISTKLGADGVPVKSMTVTASSTGEYTLRQCGVNLFAGGSPVAVTNTDADASTPSSIDSYGYMIALPPGFYIFSIAWKNGETPSATEISLRVYNGTTRKTFWDNTGNAKTTANVTGDPTSQSFPNGISSVNGKVKILVQQGDVIYIYGRTKSLAASHFAKFDIQIEASQNVSAPYSAHNIEAYHKYEDYNVTIETADTPTAVEGVVTALGDNTFFAFKTADPTAFADNVSGTFRLDPTLVYNKLAAAIVAAGAT